MSQANVSKSRAKKPANGNRQDPLLSYIHEMLIELGSLCPAQAGPLLPYLIDVARLEAEEAQFGASAKTR